MDSLHENSSSGSENEDQPPTRLSDQARVSTCHHTSQSSDDQESETEDAQEVGSSRKQSKQNSDEMSSSGEERNNKQSSPIILQIGRYSPFFTKLFHDNKYWVGQHIL